MRVHEILPHEYATAYLSAKPHGKESQRKAVQGCPVEWRELVRKHAELIEEKQRLKGER